MSLEPNNIQAIHNLCVVYVERGLLQYAEACLLKAVSLAPKEEYLLRHLSIVRSRIKKQKGEDHKVVIKSDAAERQHPQSSKQVYTTVPGHVSSIPTSSIELPEKLVYSKSSSIQASNEVPQVLQEKQNISVKQ